MVCCILGEDENAASEAQQAAKSKRLAYELAGGADGIRRLVKEFYDIVENEPEGRVLYVLHLRGHGIHARIEQFNFLSGFLDDPRLYVER